MANGFQGPPAVDFYSHAVGAGRYAPGQRGVEAEAADQCRPAGCVLRFHGPRPVFAGLRQAGFTVAQKLGSAGDQDGALKFLTLAQTAADKAQAYQRDSRDFGFDQTDARDAL
jgi:hypothetical protein